MFAFYFAVLSAITPPVALAVFAASGLAKSDLWRTGWAAVKVGAAGFIVPFMFVYEPALLMIGEWPTIIWRFILSCVGIALLAGGLHGYLFRAMPPWERIVSIAGAFLLVVPTLWADIAGLVILGSLLAIQYLVSRSIASASVGAAAVNRPGDRNQ